MRKTHLFIIALFLAPVWGCTNTGSPSTGQAGYAQETALSPVVTVTQTPRPTQEPTTTPTVTLTPTSTTQPSPTVSPTVTIGSSGPNQYPTGVNPLTGLAVSDPQSLDLPPALVSISNSPITARPQAGLSFSPLVFEIYIGEGATRFLALFYGDYPPSSIEGEPAAVGPLRSGRLPYESLRRLYGGFLVFASAAERVLDKLNDYIIVYNQDLSDVNGARIAVDELLQNAQQRQPTKGWPMLQGNRFDPLPPPGGKPAQGLWVGYHRVDQVFWRYSEQLKAYARWQDDGEDTSLRQFTDWLNNDNLSFENVVVLFANYRLFSETYFDIDLFYITRNPALLFRDGQMYPIYWTTLGGFQESTTGRMRPIRFIDYEGNAVPLKPGQTWVEIVQLYNPYYETADSRDFHKLSSLEKPGSGFWAVRFIPPAVIGE